VIGIDIGSPREVALPVARCDFDRHFPFRENSFDAVLRGEAVEHAISDDHSVASSDKNERVSVWRSDVWGKRKLSSAGASLIRRFGARLR
jgi:hypothetical protein